MKTRNITQNFRRKIVADASGEVRLLRKDGYPDGRALRTRYFNDLISFRISKDMNDMIDFWINNPKCVDSNGNPLFTSRGHFIKASIIRHFDFLKSSYFDNNTR